MTVRVDAAQLFFFSPTAAIRSPLPIDTGPRTVWYRSLFGRRRLTRYPRRTIELTDFVQVKPRVHVTRRHSSSQNTRHRRTAEDRPTDRPTGSGDYGPTTSEQCTTRTPKQKFPNDAYTPRVGPPTRKAGVRELVFNCTPNGRNGEFLVHSQCRLFQIKKKKTTNSYTYISGLFEIVICYR